jgi:dephospho-CoA kinase
MSQYKVVCLSGLCGAGKSIVSDYFIKENYQYLRFGQITMDELKKRNLPISEENERLVREELRDQYGMAAFAILNLPKLDQMIENGNVIADGLYSFAEYKILKEHFKDKFVLIAVYAPPKIRYERLANRKLDPADTQGRNRPLNSEEAKSRDYREIEKSDKGGPIAMADYTIINTKDFSYLQKQVKEIIDELQST